MNKRILVIVVILVGIGLYAGGFFTSQAFAQTGRPTWMMGGENGAYGPGMMGNGQYGSGMMSGGNMGMMGGMMNGQVGSGMMEGGQYGSMMGGNMMNDWSFAPNVETTVSVDEAVNIAQEYLDVYLPGKTTDETADEFPGYYTLHILEDGKIVGMLSVNAYTGQVFLHH